MEKENKREVHIGLREPSKLERNIIYVTLIKNTLTEFVLKVESNELFKHREGEIKLIPNSKDGELVEMLEGRCTFTHNYGENEIYLKRKIGGLLGQITHENGALLKDPYERRDKLSEKKYRLFLEEVKKNKEKYAEIIRKEREAWENL